MNRPSLSRAGVVIALALAVVALAPAPSAAASAASPAAASGWLRVAHLSPDTKPLAVSLTAVSGASTPGRLPDVVYGAVSNYLALPPATYVVRLAPSGSPAGSTPVAQAVVQVKADRAATVAVFGRTGALQPTVLGDDLRPPAAGHARVRLVQASVQPGAVSVTEKGGTRLAAGVGPGAVTAYADLPSGQLHLTATRGAASARASVHLRPGEIVSLVALDDAARGLVLRPVVDTATAGPAPKGFVATGGGYLAHRPAVEAPAVALTVALLVVLLAGLVVVRRRPVARRRALAAALVTLLPAGVLAGCTAAGPARSTTGAAPVHGATAVPGSAGAARFQDPAPISPPGTPVGILLPGIGVRSGLERLGRDASGGLQTPEDPGTAGWYADGTVPGQVGPAVIAGHLDGAETPGVFADLHRLRRGDPVVVQLADGRAVHFTVTRTQTASRFAFPAYAVYGPVPDPELRLITCAGSWDPASGTYSADLIVFATEVP